jgi:ATP-dependent helicase Lhr and Lhr-like helicase
MIKYKKKRDNEKDLNQLLNPIVKKWFFSNFKEFSIPQLSCVSEVHARNNILLSAPTGGTKTLSSFMAILNELVDSSEKGILEDKIYAVYISPLKALNRDISLNLIEPLEEMAKLAEKELGVRVAVRTGDTTQNEKTKMLRRPPHILITTPESLAILLSSKKFSEHLSQVDWTIIDEIHSIAENKRGVHLSLSLERLQRLSPGMCRIGLSATVAPLEEVAKYLAGNERSCKIIDVQYLKETDLQVISPVEDLVNTSYEKITDETYKLLDKLIQEHKTTLVFTNTRAATERIVHHLKEKFPEKYYEIDEDQSEKTSLIGAHHGSLSKEHRLKLEDDLRAGKLKAVVCLHGDTEILTAKGHWKKIKNIKIGETVQSVDENLKLNKNRVINTFKVKNKGEIVEISTRLGKSINATKDHKFMTIDQEGVIEWKEAGKIKEGEFIGCLRKTLTEKTNEEQLKYLAFQNYPDKGFLELSESYRHNLRQRIISEYKTIKTFWRKYFEGECSYGIFLGALSGKYAFNIKRIRKIASVLNLDQIQLFDNITQVGADKRKIKKIEITPNFLRLLGFMVAEGYISWRGIYFSNKDLTVLKFYRNLIKKITNYNVFEKDNDNGTTTLCWESTFVGEFVSSLGFHKGKKARTHRIPYFLFSLPSEFRADFLAGYFDGDGYIELKSKDDRVYSAGFSTTSKGGARDISKLLLTLGILNSIRKKYEDSFQEVGGRIIHKNGWFYDVSILGGNNLRTFAELINPARKNIARVKEVLRLNGYCNLDVIPNIGKVIRRERLKKDISNYRLLKEKKVSLSKYELGNRNISRRQLVKACSILGTNNEYLHTLAKSDIFWDRVSKISNTNQPNYVYNIEVENDHNYIAEEFLTKNCSTSLELGLDIGFIDLVVCIGSPKSVARFLQRAGRSGHKLHETVKSKILVNERDDLVECSVLLKYGVEKKIDRIHIPTNALDVLAQQLFGMALEDIWDIKDLYDTVRKSYCYQNLTREDFYEVLDYLAGNFISLEDRHVYARIWWDKEEGKIGKKGRLARVIYMTNIGTIPDQQGIIVKNPQGQRIGTIDEGFLEKLNKGDVFVLGGNTYRFNYARGMVAQVTATPGRKPTVPSWYSERLPLSYDLAKGICHFRKLMEEKFKKKRTKKEILDFINEYLYVDNIAAEALYNYFKDQYDYVGIPHEKKLLVEHYRDEQMKNYVVFHSLYGRRVNDVLSRALAFAIARSQRKDVEIGINDNGFYVSFDRNVNVLKAFDLVTVKEFGKVLDLAIDKSEILKRRFRHCAGRSLMILRNYKGQRKRVGRQQVSSMILMSAVRRISNDFFLLRETRREILEDLMDIESALEVLTQIKDGTIKIEEKMMYY